MTKPQGKPGAFVPPLYRRQHDRHRHRPGNGKGGTAPGDDMRSITGPHLIQHLTPIFSENVAILKAWIAGWTAENLKELSQ